MTLLQRLRDRGLDIALDAEGRVTYTWNFLPTKEQEDWLAAKESDLHRELLLEERRNLKTQCDEQAKWIEGLVGTIKDVAEIKDGLWERLKTEEGRTRYLRMERDLLKISLDSLRIGWDELVQDRQAPELDDALLRKLVLLSHPDRHDGNALATEVTATLNRIRASRRARA